MLSVGGLWLHNVACRNGVSGLTLSGRGEILHLLDQWVLMLGQLHRLDVRIFSAILPPTKLALVELVVLLLKFAHLFNLIEIDYKAGIQIVQVLDALTAEDRGVLAAVEVLDALLVLLAHVHCTLPFVGFLALVSFGISLQTFLEVD